MSKSCNALHNVCSEGVSLVDMAVVEKEVVRFGQTVVYGVLGQMC